MYLLESSAVLAFFYLLYLLFLRKETFFSLNRFYLISILVFSLLFPFTSFDLNPAKLVVIEQPLEEISKFRMSYYEAMAAWEFETHNATILDAEKSTGGMAMIHRLEWITIMYSAFLFLYAMGILICLSRITYTFIWIWKMIATNPQVKMEEVKVVLIPDFIAPFSFFKYVFVHKALVNTPEFDQILEHEKTHIHQGHSIDLIFVQLLAAIFWFNPAIWQLIKSLKTTHEYIADKKIINSGYSLVEYQSLLLKQLISNNSFGLVHNFNLTFIKKRITMMKNKKSGWPGKVKVAMAIASTIVFSGIIVQCNSNLEEQVYLDSELVSGSNSDFTRGINLPVLPETGFSFDGDLNDALNFTIGGNKLTINGEHFEVDEIVPFIENGDYPVEKSIILFRVDKDQNMGFVKDVQLELRKADRRRLLYLGQTTAGAKVETTLLLPPTPENAAKNGMPVQPDIFELETENKLDIEKIDMGNTAGIENQQKVYDFVKSHIQKQSTDYVVSARFNDEDNYNDYLLNLVYLKEGFNQIYQERAQELFGKDYYNLDHDEYMAVRKGIPMAISIAE
ncbi:hypothetical protein BH23BAC1_BH23BAC1_07230 [soil metagenome]